MNVVYEANQSNASVDFIAASDANYQHNRAHQLPSLLDTLLKPLRQWLDQIEIRNPEMAHSIARLIPAQCPFERDIIIAGHKIGHIPPLCKLNPFYEQLVSLRFRALCFLADECGEDIQSYC
jgi:hypothetical protein